MILKQHPQIHFNLNFNFERVIIERIFGDSLEKITSVYYLTRDQLSFANQKTLFHLKQCAIAASQRKSKKPISQTASDELKFSADCLLHCFNKKTLNLKIRRLIRAQKLNRK